MTLSKARSASELSVLWDSFVTFDPGFGKFLGDVGIVGWSAFLFVLCFNYFSKANLNWVSIIIKYAAAGLPGTHTYQPCMTLSVYDIRLNKAYTLPAFKVLIF